MKHFVIIGRAHGDDEDGYMLTTAETAAHARQEFIEKMRTQAGIDPSGDPNDELNNVYITGAFQSDTPISVA